jgi:hypothetical protein
MIIVNISKSGATAATEAQIRDAACRAWVLSGQCTPITRSRAVEHLVLNAVHATC